MATGAHTPTAAAATKPMNINASGGDGTHIVSDGTQGTETDSVQGVKDSDGDQDAFDAIRSEDVTPQFKANNKMTK